MNKTYRTSNTYDFSKECGEKNLSPSLTVPDQSLTIPQILDLYTRGISIDNLLHPSTGFDDPDWDDLDPTQEPAFDIVQAKIMLEETKAKIAEARLPRQRTIDEVIDESKKAEARLPRQKTIDESIDESKKTDTK